MGNSIQVNDWTFGSDMEKSGNRLNFAILDKAQRRDDVNFSFSWQRGTAAPFPTFVVRLLRLKGTTATGEARCLPLYAPIYFYDK